MFSGLSAGINQGLRMQENQEMAKQKFERLRQEELDKKVKFLSYGLKINQKQKLDKARKQWNENMDESADQQAQQLPVKKKHSHKFIRQEISKLGSYEDPDMDLSQFDKARIDATKQKIGKWMSPRLHRNESSQEKESSRENAKQSPQKNKSKFNQEKRRIKEKKESDKILSDKEMISQKRDLKSSRGKQQTDEIEPLAKEEIASPSQKKESLFQKVESSDEDEDYEDSQENQIIQMAFKYGKKKYDKRTLYIFSQRNLIRRIIVRILEHRWFENFVLFLILVNSIALAVYDYSDRDSVTGKNQVIDKIGDALTYLFLVECLMKIVGYGFIVSKFSYLRDGWNIIDFFVVITGLMEMGGGSIKLKSLRVLRVLRPLRSINAIPSMKKLVGALFQSLPDFFNVAIFLGFIFILFAILGVHQYNGVLYNRCRYNPEPEGPNFWKQVDEITRVCTKTDSGNFPCPSGYYCGNPSDYNIDLEYDNVTTNPVINYGITTFDNVAVSLLTVFQIVTTDGWTPIMYNLEDTEIPSMAAIYSIILIIIAAFFLMNLILAVIIQAFIRIQRLEIELEILKYEDEQEKKIREEQEKIEEEKREKESRLQSRTQQRDTDKTQQNAQQLTDKISDKTNQPRHSTKLLRVPSILSNFLRPSNPKKSESNLIQNSGLQSLALNEESKQSSQIGLKKAITQDIQDPPFQKKMSVVSAVSALTQLEDQKLLNNDNQGQSSNNLLIPKKDEMIVPTSPNLQKRMNPTLESKFQIIKNRQRSRSILTTKLLISGLGDPDKINQAQNQDKQSQQAPPTPSLGPASSQPDTPMVKQLTSLPIKQEERVQIEERKADFSFLKNRNIQNKVVNQITLFKKEQDHQKQLSNSVIHQNLNQLFKQLTNLASEKGGNIQGDVIPEQNEEDSIDSLQTQLKNKEKSSKLGSKASERGKPANMDFSPMSSFINPQENPGDQEKSGLIQYTEKEVDDVMAKRSNLKKQMTKTQGVEPDGGEILRKLIQMRKDERQHQDQQAEGTKSKFAQAMNSLLNKKQEEFRTQEQYISQVLKDAKREYQDKENTNKQTNLRSLVQQKLSLKLSKQNKEEKMSKLELSIYKRAESNKLYKFFYKIQTNRFFTNFISVLIIGNTIDLSLDRYPIEKQQADIQDAVNTFFSFLFVAEMIIKLVGSGVKYYLKDAFNIFDCIVVVSSMIDFSLQQALNSESNGAITAFRAFRLLRVFKLAKSWKKLQNLLTTMVSTLKDISTFSILLFLFMFIYALLALELFANRVKFGLDGRVDLDNGISTNTNFDDFLNAFTTVFIVLTNDGWSTIFFDCYRSAGSAQSIIYFVSLIIIGQKILLNLFLAILLENFDEESLNQDIQDQLNSFLLGDKKKETIAEQIKNYLEKFYHRVTKSCRRRRAQSRYDLSKSAIEKEPNILAMTLGGMGVQTAKKEDLNSSKGFLLDEQAEESLSPIKRKRANQFLNDKEGKIVGISLNIFNQTNRLRVFVFKLVTNIWFEYFILVVITVSGVQLMQERPLLDPNSKEQEILLIIDIVTTVIFCIECVLKVIAFGFIRNGKSSYLKNSWNMIDFTIIIFSIISLTPLSNSFKTFKMLRVVRGIRVISRNEGLKVAIKALIQAIPQIINVSIITMLFFLIFGIISVNFFKGKYFYCDYTNVDGTQVHFVNHKWECLSFGGEWVNKPWRFDNIFEAMKSMFQMATTSAWSDIMYVGTSCTEIDYIPRREYNFYWVFFFIVFIIVGSFFMLNLFVGVVISIFNREKDNIRGNNLLTDSQKQWIDTMMITLKAKPIKFHKRPDNKIRRIFFVISKNKIFNRTIFACIVVNTLILLIKYYNQPTNVSLSTDILNYIFTAVFAVEAIVKIIAIDKQYFDDNWNIFDFTVVIGSFISMLFTAFTSVRLGGATTIIRAFRITRVFRLVKKAKTLKTVFNSFIYTLPALANVGGLLLLLLYLYSIVGVILFGDVMRNGLITDTLNYETFWNAFVTLFVISTGDAWDQIMDASIKSRNIQFQCIENPSYQDYLDNGSVPIGCGSGEIGYLFYYSYILLVNLIFLNLFIAIILQGYEDTQQKESKLFNQDKLDKFRKVWSKFDPNATTYIKISQLSDFLFELGKPLGWDDKMRDKIYQQEKFIANLDLPIYNNFSDYMFLDVLEALALRVVVLDQLHKESDNIIKKQQENFEMLGSEQYDINDYRRAQKEMKQKIEQDINKMKFKEDVQNIQVVKEVQQKEQKRKTTFQVQPDSHQGQVFTSVHQAAAMETVKHMKYLLNKKKMMQAKTVSTPIDETQQTKSQVNQEKSDITQIEQITPLGLDTQKQPEQSELKSLTDSVESSSDTSSQNSSSSSSLDSDKQRDLQPHSPAFNIGKSQLSSSERISAVKQTLIPQNNVEEANQKSSSRTNEVDQILTNIDNSSLRAKEESSSVQNIDNDLLLGKPPKLNNLVSALPLKFSQANISELINPQKSNYMSSSKSGDSNSHRLNTDRVNEIINQELDEIKGKEEIGAPQDIIEEEDSFMQDSNRSKIGVAVGSPSQRVQDQQRQLNINLLPPETQSSNSTLQQQTNEGVSLRQGINTNILQVIKPQKRKKLRASIGGTGEYIESQDSFSVNDRRNFSSSSNNQLDNQEDQDVEQSPDQKILQQVTQTLIPNQS